MPEYWLNIWLANFTTSETSVGKLENMKYIYKIMKEKRIETDIKEWRYDIENSTILMVAVKSLRPNVLRWLLHDFQFDVNEKDFLGRTALHEAAFNCRLENDWCSGLYRFVCDKSTVLVVDQSTARQNVLIHNQMECAKLLLDAGALHLKAPSTPFSHGGTPLDDSKRHGYKELQELLESHFHLR